MVKVNVLEAEVMSIELGSIREAVVYKTGLNAIYGNEYSVTITDADGYIVSGKEQRLFLMRMAWGTENR